MESQLENSNMLCIQVYHYDYLNILLGKKLFVALVGSLNPGYFFGWLSSAFRFPFSLLDLHGLLDITCGKVSIGAAC